MKFATVEANGKEWVGAVDDVAMTIRRIDANNMLDVIGNKDIPIVGEALPLSQVSLRAPIPRPSRNILCVGKNYRAHAKEFALSGYEAGAVKGADVDEYPAVFTKFPSAVVGSGAVVDLHSNVTKSVDYEGELAVIIGRAGRNISEKHAMDYVWGYSIINDVTARDRQKNHRQWFLGKSLDTFCPMGPWITTADEIDPRNLQLKTWVNGELCQDANTDDLIFAIPYLIAEISSGITLVPGDIIATGTPAGVGIGFDPPRFLKSGDRVDVSIDKLGTLSNTFR